MADRKKRGTGFPGTKDENDLQADFDAWDDKFDAIFDDLDGLDDLGAAESSEPAGRASGGESPFSGADPLPTLVEPMAPMEMEPGDPDLSVPVMGGRTGLGSRGQPVPPPMLPVEEDDGEGVLTSALRPPEPDDFAFDSAMDLFADIEATDADEVSNEVTRVIGASNDLAKVGSRTPASPSAAPRRLPLSATAQPPESKKRPVRRTAAIVRREDLERSRPKSGKGGSLFDDVFRDRMGSDDEVDFSAETTRVADARQIEKMAESAEADEASARLAAQAFFAQENDGPEPPAITLEVDDEFYDDIEIGDQASPENAEADADRDADAIVVDASAVRGDPRATPAARRVSQHLVRRNAQKTEPAASPATTNLADPSATDSPTVPRQGASRIRELAEKASMDRALDPDSTLDMRVVESDLRARTGGQRPRPAPENRASVPRAPLPPPPPGPGPRSAVRAGPGKELEAQFDDDFEIELVDSGQPTRAAAAAPISEPEFEFDLVVSDPGAGPESDTGLAFELELTDSDPGRRSASETELAFDLIDGDAPTSRPSGPSGLGDGDSARSDELPRLASDSEFDFTEPEASPSDDFRPGSSRPAARPDTPTVEVGDADIVSESVAEMSARAPARVSPAPGSSGNIAGRLAEGTAPRLLLSGQAPARTAEFEQQVTAPLPPHIMARALARERAVLDEANVAPDLPPAVLPVSEPTIDLGALAVSESVMRADPDERQRDIVSMMELLDREIAETSEPTVMARFCLEAGRLAEQLGDVDRARQRYEEALDADSRLAPAMRALRRIERSTANWTQAVHYLGTELSLASPPEQHALAAHGAELLMACGEEDLARVAVGEILDRDATDTRALLTNLELAFTDQRHDEFIETMARLGQALVEPELAGTLAAVQGLVAEKAAREGNQPASKASSTRAIAAYRASVEAGSRWSRVALARMARHSGDTGMALAAVEGLSATELGERDPGLLAALSWRQSLWAGRDGRVTEALEALSLATERAPGETLLLAELAERELASGRGEEAVAALLRLATSAPSPAEQAAAYLRAGHCLLALGRRDEAIDALRRAHTLDPCNSRARAALEQALLEAGDIEALIELDRRAASADPHGAVLERVRAARRLTESQRFDDAMAVLSGYRADGSDSHALDEERLFVLDRAGRHDDRVGLLFELEASGKDSIDAERMLYRAALAATERTFWLDTLLARARTAPIGSPPTEITRDDHRPAAKPDRDGEDAIEAIEAIEHRDQRDRMIVRAIDAWQRVLEVESGSIDARHAIIALAEMLGDRSVLDHALEEAQKASLDPALAVTFALRRMALIPADDRGRAEELGRQAMALSPEDPRALLALMLALVSDGQRYGDAATVLEDRASAIGPGDEAIAARFRAAALLLDCADEPAPAAEVLRAILTVRPGFHAAAAMLASAERRMGDLAAAYAGLVSEASDASDAGDAGRRASAAELAHAAEVFHHVVGDPAQAIALYKKARAARPGDPLLRAGLARAAEASGDTTLLADLALEELAHAEELGDNLAKADAYEELARIDGQLRGDHDSALLSYESASAADPGRPWLSSVIERAYLAAERWADLAALYERELEALPEEGRDRLALALERARLAEQLTEPPSDILAHYRSVHQLDRRCRIALFRLEAEARRQGPSLSLAAFETDLADYFASDLTAHVIFLTRAADTLTEVGEIDSAIERYKDANERFRTVHGRGHAPALFGWRHAALVGKLWIDVAEAALAEAEVASTAHEKAALCHLAGVTLMDRALTGERAVPALRNVLEAEPTHTDAFARLRILYDEQGEHDELIALLRARLEVEDSMLGKARLHRALADLYRNFLGDRDQAKEHLQAILDLVPTDLGAIATLSDIAWEQGAWVEAADALLARARLETSAQILKGIFYRLGIIYAEHVPDAERAIRSFKKVLEYAPHDEGALDHLSRLGIEVGNWKMALAACQRLIKLDQDVDTKVVHRQRMAHIYAHGMGDRPRAQRALLEAFDEAPTSDGALSALTEFFENAGDTRSMRFHLDRVIGAMRIRLGKDPRDGVAYRVIARALEARERAGVPGSLACARTVAELALLFGFVEDGGEAIAALAAQAAAAEPSVAGLDKAEIDERLFPATVPTSARQLFGLLGDRLAKHVGIDLRLYGVSRSDRLRGREDPVVSVAHEVAAQLGIDQLALYVTDKEPIFVACEPTSPISIIVGSGLAKPERKPELRFCVGRALKLVGSSFAVPARLTSEDFAVLVTALLRLFDPEFSAPGMDSEAVTSHQQRLRRLIPSSLFDELQRRARDLIELGIDQRSLQAGIQAAGDRAGLLACGSMRASLAVLSGMRGHADLAHSAIEDERAADLVRFAISEDHAALRGILGH